MSIERNPNFRRWFGKSQVVDGHGKPMVVYHGSPTKGITEFADGTTAFGIFFSPDESTASYYTGGDDRGEIYAVYLKVEKLADFDEPDVFDKIARESIDYTEVRSDEDAAAFAARLYREGFGKNDVVTNFFKAIDGFDQLDEEYTIEDLIDDELIDASDVEALVRDIKLPHVTAAFKEACPVTAEELDNAREAYGTQNFYLYYQNDFMRTAQHLGYDGVVFSDPSSTGAPISYVVFKPEQIKSATNNSGAFDPNNPDMTDGGRKVAPPVMQRRRVVQVADEGFCP